jgi:hypothetical protein
MPLEKIHRFHLALTTYVLNGIREYLSRPRFHAFVSRHLPPPLLDAIRVELDEPVPVLLNAAEMTYLVEFFEESLGHDHPWPVDERVHRGWQATIPEIREALTSVIAEEWAQTSSRAVRSLESTIAISEGLAIIANWMAELRRYLRICDRTDYLPCPEGGFPTPSAPAPPEFSTPSAPTRAIEDGKACRPMERRELSRREAAQYLGVSLDTLVELHRSGCLLFRDASPPGSARPLYRYAVKDLEEFIQSGYRRESPEPARAHRRPSSRPQKYDHLDLE